MSFIRAKLVNNASDVWFPVVYGNQTTRLWERVGAWFSYCTIWRAADRIPYESSSTERIPASKQIKKWIVDFERLVSYSYPGLPPFWSLI